MVTVQAINTCMVLSESESSAAATLAEALLDELLDVLLDEVLPNAFPEVEVSGLEFDPDAFSTCLCFSVWHSEILCLLRLQWVHFLPLSCFFFPLPVLLVKYTDASPPAA